MATLVELTRYYNVNREDAKPRKVTVNLDTVKTMDRIPERPERPEFEAGKGEYTFIWFGGYGDNLESLDVMETPEAIRYMVQGPNPGEKIVAF